MIFNSLFWWKSFPLIKNSCKERKKTLIFFFFLWFLWINVSNNAKKMPQIKLTTSRFFSHVYYWKFLKADIQAISNTSTRVQWVHTLRPQVEGYICLLIFRKFSIIPAVIWVYPFTNFQENFQPPVFHLHNSISLSKLFWPAVRNNCSSDFEILSFIFGGWNQ